MMTADEMRAIAAQHAKDEGHRGGRAHQHRGALLDHMRALAQPVPYRPGLPTVEQVRAHEERGGMWCWLVDGHARVVYLAVYDDGRIVWRPRQGGGDWRSVELVTWDAVRPAIGPDGTPCAWPGEPDPWAALEALRRPAATAPRFAAGDLVVRRAVIPAMGLFGELVTAADACRVYRVVSVREDEHAADREGEPGFGHELECEPVAGARRTRVTLYQGLVCLWADRRAEVLAAYREALALLESL